MNILKPCLAPSLRKVQAMRKQMSVNIDTLMKALQNLGYRQSRKRNRLELELKCGKFHIILNEHKKHVVIHLHVDVPEYKVGPTHRSRHRGRDISEEFESIKKEYKKLRTTVTRQ